MTAKAEKTNQSPQAVAKERRDAPQDGDGRALTQRARWPGKAPPRPRTTPHRLCPPFCHGDSLPSHHAPKKIATEPLFLHILHHRARPEMPEFGCRATLAQYGTRPCPIMKQAGFTIAIRGKAGPDSKAALGRPASRGCRSAGGGRSYFKGTRMSGDREDAERADRKQSSRSPLQNTVREGKGAALPAQAGCSSVAQR